LLWFGLGLLFLGKWALVVPSDGVLVVSRKMGPCSVLGMGALVVPWRPLVFLRRWGPLSCLGLGPLLCLGRWDCCCALVMGPHCALGMRALDVPWRLGPCCSLDGTLVIIIIIRKFITRTCSQALSMNRRRGQSLSGLTVCINC